MQAWLAGNQSDPPRPQPTPVRHGEGVGTPSASAKVVSPASPSNSDVVGVPSEKSLAYSPSVASEQLTCEHGSDAGVPKDGDKSVPGDMESPGDFDLDLQVPDIQNKDAPRFQKGEHHLSENAIRCRARRIFTPRIDGTKKVSETVFNEWHQKGQPRKNLEEIFKQCGYDPES